MTSYVDTGYGPIADGTEHLPGERSYLLDRDPYAGVPPTDEEPDRGTGPARPHRPPLEFLTFADLAAKVAAAGPRRWLIRGIWPAGDYGVIGAESKAQKTWTAVDLAVAVAARMRWLGEFEIESCGPVLMFVGEGGEGNFVRRVQATAECFGVEPNSLPITVCTRAPHLNDLQHVAMMAAAVEDLRPALVIIDPFYLAAQGANLADLYGMGELLERPQLICQQFGAALVVVHHFNRKLGSGRDRMAGAGPAEWGRVLITATVTKRRTEMPSRKSIVTTRLAVVGGEVPDQLIDVTREIWADEPDEMDSPLHLTVSARRVEDSPLDADEDGQLRLDDLADVREWNDPLRWPLPVDVAALRGGGQRAIPHIALYMRAHASDPGGVGVSRVDVGKALLQMKNGDGSKVYRDDTVIRNGWSALVAAKRIEPRGRSSTGVALWVSRDGDPRAR